MRDAPSQGGGMAEHCHSCKDMESRETMGIHHWAPCAAGEELGNPLQILLYPRESNRCGKKTI